MFKSKLLNLILLIIFIGIVENIDQNIVSVRLKNGLINGQIETTIDGNKLNVFRGVPYAEPPVGSLRFKKPLPLRKWTKPIDAFKLPNACYQSNEYINIVGGNVQLSEDCLYMNIWSPALDENSDILKPVMFFIHGGGYQVGSSSESYYDGQVIAAKGDVIVVTINYRLNSFGFFYTGTEEAPGNVGLWDQAMALEWVNDNIRYFGGDPKRITIFGESAGSWSVSLHTLSPVTRNLFQNAVLNSGAYINRFAEDKPEDHLKRWLKGAQLIGCNDENDDKFTERIIECLRNKEPKELVSMVEILSKMSPYSFKMFTNVVIDGQFLPNRPTDMLRSGDFNKKLNIMFSTTSNEGSNLLAFSYDIIKFHPLTPKNFSLDEAVQEAHSLTQGLSSEVQVNGEEAAKLYFTGLSNSNDYDLLRRTIGVIFGDYLITCPTIQFAKEFFKNSDYNSNVYQYLFNSKTEMEFPICFKWMGVCHGNDIYPMFGVPFILQNDKITDRDREISAQLIEILTDFAKNGNPPAQSGTEWANYFRIDDQIIAPFYEITNNPKPETNFGIGYKINECEYFWNKYIS